MLIPSHSKAKPLPSVDCNPTLVAAGGLSVSAPFPARLHDHAAGIAADAQKAAAGTEPYKSVMDDVLVGPLSSGAFTLNRETAPMPTALMDHTTGVRFFCVKALAYHLKGASDRADDVVDL
jgi:hypothetical protein